MVDGFELSSILSESDCVPTSACSHVVFASHYFPISESLNRWSREPIVGAHLLCILEELLFVLENSRILVVSTPLLCGVADRRAYYSEIHVITVSTGHVGIIDCSLLYCLCDLHLLRIVRTVSFVVL